MCAPDDHPTPVQTVPTPNTNPAWLDLGDTDADNGDWPSIKTDTRLFPTDA